MRVDLGKSISTEDLEPIFNLPIAIKKVISGVSLNSQFVRAGDIFFALEKNESKNHEYCEDALRYGASCVVTPFKKEGAGFIVKEPILALGSLAKWWREQWSGTLIALTASVGKTTIKELLKAIFAQKHQVLATEGNFNNELGVPLTLFRLSNKYDVAVIEMGARCRGDIRYLVDIAKPQACLIGQLYPNHMESFGDWETLIATKCELIESVPNLQYAVYMRKSVVADRFQDRSIAKYVKTFGKDGDVSLAILPSEIGSMSVKIQHHNHAFDAKVSLIGDFNASNIEASVAMGLLLGEDAQNIIDGFASFRPAKQRMNLKKTSTGTLLLDDTYNANSESVIKSVEYVSAHSDNALIILGELAELGSDPASVYAHIANNINHLSLTLWTYGEQIAFLAARLNGKGRHFNKKDELISTLKKELQKFDIVLVKGSRRTRMEEVVDAIASENLALLKED